MLRAAALVSPSPIVRASPLFAAPYPPSGWRRTVDGRQGQRWPASLTAVKAWAPVTIGIEPGHHDDAGGKAAMRGTIRMQRRALRGGLAAAALGVGGLRICDLRAQERVVIRAIGTRDLHRRTGAAIERLAGALAGVSQGRVTLAA